MSYIFSSANTPSAHVTWHIHDSKTFHQELAHPHMRYHLEDSCDDISLLTIHHKCNVQTLIPGELKPLEDTFVADNDFALRYASN